MLYIYRASSLQPHTLHQNYTTSNINYKTPLKPTAIYIAPVIFTATNYHKTPLKPTAIYITDFILIVFCVISV